MRKGFVSGMENGDVLMTDQIKERWYMVLDPTTYTSRMG